MTDWPHIGFFVDEEIASDKSLTLSERFVLAYITSFFRNGRKCFASAGHMAEVLGLNESHLKEVRSALVEKNRLRRFEIHGQAHFEPVVERPAPSDEASEKPTGGVGNSDEGGRKNRRGGSEIPTHTYKNIIKVTEKREERESTPPLPNSPEWYLMKASEALEEPNGQGQWESNNQYILAGRRPMKRYPHLWFTTSELAKAVEVVRDSLPPESDWKAVFDLAESEATNQLVKRGRESANCYKYVTGYCLQTVLDTMTKTTYLSNSLRRAK